LLSGGMCLAFDCFFAASCLRNEFTGLSNVSSFGICILRKWVASVLDIFPKSIYVRNLT
jgi:hypothetical protein